jgi:uncharacterized Zn-binding protein involved in type VI secretion
MPAAARLTDMHTCPADGGGPITGPGTPTVLIGGLPAARLGDSLACGATQDKIITGSKTVLIGGLPAARVGDNTGHGGVIYQGANTIIIG